MGKSTAAKPKRRADLWIRGGDLYFCVEEDLFRVHSYFFVRESEEWKGRLVGPDSQGDKALKEGKNETEAIVLENEKADEFAQFVSIFYNSTFDDYKQVATNDWKVILCLASKWGFNQVHALAIRHLEARLDIELVERVKLYQDNKVSESTLAPWYKQLVEREKLLEFNEAEALGLKTYVSIQQARERLRSQVSAKPPYMSPIPKDKQKDVDEIVAFTFGISLEDVKSASGPRPNGA